MARKPRIHYPGAVYHVILRGNAEAPIFFGDRDRYRLCMLLQETVEKFGCRIHGFCFMTNHLHLVVQVGQIPLSRIMQNLSLRYTKWINASQGRTGHLFQGRYKAILLDADAYLLQLVRYIHLNPVRAGMVTHPEQYPWSGHRGYLGREILPWLTTARLLSLFSADPESARQGYCRFIADGIDEGRRNDLLNGTCEGRILGDDRFAVTALSKSNRQPRSGFSLPDIVSAVCRRYEISETELRAPGKMRPYSEARALAAVIVRQSSHLSLTQLGTLTNRDVSALGKAAQRLTQQARNDARLTRHIEELRDDVLNPPDV